MPKVLINQYKRQDVLRCSHKAHFRFEKNVSVYHVLKEKQCFPQGCIWFLWKCRLLNKGQSCPKRYQHVGRDCFSCKNYLEEKVNYQPEIILNDEEFKKFQRELEEFEEWLERTVGKWVEFSGKVSSVKPHFRKVIYGKKEILEFPGYLISFKEGYLDRVFFQDSIFVTVSRRTQLNLKFAMGDEVEFKARLRADKGRIVLDKIKQVEFVHKEEAEVWSLSQALVAKNTGKEFDCQPGKCMMCENGSLLDVVEKSGNSHSAKRHLFCLIGMENPDECVYHLGKKLMEYKQTKSLS
ncbi:MAG: hypothetical protein WCE90_04450 [Candidatus Zixiibacteriota bacterium]